MSDFIKIQNNSSESNSPDYQDLCELANKINQVCKVSDKYIGMHLRDRILYLTYYIKYTFLRASCYKIDIRIEKGKNGKPTSNYVVCFKRQSNDPINANECSKIINSDIFSAFYTKNSSIQGENCIVLGKYDSATLCRIMKTFVLHLINAGGVVQ